MVWMVDFWSPEYYTAAYRGALALAGGIVLVLLLLAIRSKTRYIYQLKEELALLEGGDLEHPITIKAGTSWVSWPPALTPCAKASSSARRGKKRPAGQPGS